MWCPRSFALALALASPATHAAPEPTRPASSADEEATARDSDVEDVEVENPAFPLHRRTTVAYSGRRLGPADLASYFVTPNARAARAEFDAGHDGRVIELLAREGAGVPVRYLRALASLRLQPTRAAAREMEALVREDPAIADRCAVQAALAWEDLADLGAARRLFASVPQSSRLFADARFGLSRVLRRQRDLPGASEALEPLTAASGPLWGRDVAAEALIAQADLARERRDGAREQAALVRLWSGHPRSPLAAQAERRLRSVRLPLEAQVARAEALIELHRNRAGLQLLQPIAARLALPDPLACRAHFAEGKALRKERQHSEAERVLQPVTQRCLDPDLRARSLYVLASSQSIVHPAAAIASYQRLAREFPEHPFADDALFYVADLQWQAGDIASALSTLSAVAERYRSGDFFSEALFKAFWIHHRLGEDEAGLSFLDRIEAELAQAGESYDVERARYWRARVLDERGDTAQALRLWEGLALEHPATYYGLLGRERLSERASARAAAIATRLSARVAADPPGPLDAGSLLDDAHFRAGIELLRLGFEDAASSELLAAGRTGQPTEAVRLLVAALAQTGDARAAHAVARLGLRRDLGGPLTAKTRAFWDLAYPTAYRDLVERHCRPAGLDPDLLQALMREESALDPKALSWAGALGLTQLMLPTARGVAQQLKLRRPTQEALLDPSLNIQLGAAYLGKLLARFSGNAAYALAGYNAGAGAVDRWRADRRSAELDVWVEEIPIAETRAYVKRVLRSYNTYRLLGGRPLSSILVDSPAGGGPRASR